MQRWPTYLYGFLAAVLVTLIAYVSLSWTQYSTSPAWIGEDPGTSFIFCALSRPEKSIREGEYRLTRAPALFGSLSTVNLSQYPEPNILVTVYEDGSFLSQALIQNRRWLTHMEYQEMVQSIANTGILQTIPNDDSVVVDGIWYGFEHRSLEGMLAFGSNDMNAIGSVVAAFRKNCGEICETAFELADQTKRSGEYDLIYSNCPPFSQFVDSRTVL